MDCWCYICLEGEIRENFNYSFIGVCTYYCSVSVQNINVASIVTRLYAGLYVGTIMYIQLIPEGILM